MAKAGSKYAVPANPLRVTETIWKKGKLIHRVHSSTYTETEFNPSPKSNARFSPIRDVAGNIIPVLYGGSTMDCALMETVFRDVPYSRGPKNVDKTRLSNQVHSIVVAQTDLVLIDLGKVALRRLGIDRAHLIDTTKHITLTLGSGRRPFTTNSPSARASAGSHVRTTVLKRLCYSGVGFRQEV